MLFGKYSKVRADVQSVQQSFKPRRVNNILSKAISLMLMMGTALGAWATNLEVGDGVTLVIRKDGKVCSWGSNYAGRLGDASKNDSSIPLEVVGLSNITSVAAGGRHNMALDSSGTVWAWGESKLGQVGNNSLSGSLIPTKVDMTNLKKAKAIAANAYESFAIDENNTVWAWGYNYAGFLGVGAPHYAQSTPFKGNLSQVAELDAHGWHTLALDANQNVWSWGKNDKGEVGTGSISIGVSQPKKLMQAQAAKSGGEFSLVLKLDSTVWGWGKNDVGQLGNGSTTDSLQPTQVIFPSGVKIVSISAGYRHTLAIDTQGQLWTWGKNDHGQLGNGSTVAFSNVPVKVATDTGLVNIVEFSAGLDHSAVLKQDGTVCVWGWGTFGQIGNGKNQDAFKPVCDVLNVNNNYCASTPSVQLVANPPASVCLGSTFDVTIRAEKTDTQSVDTVTINLGFDPATLKFNSLTNSGVLDFESTNDYGNGGNIKFMAGVWDNPVPTQTFDMFTVNFTALQATETTLTYDTSQSILASEGESIPYSVENGQLTVSNCFDYQVDLQRETPKPDSSWETALDISLGTQTSATKYTNTCDENGQGNIAIESALGNEDYICVKNAHTLANKIVAPIDISNIVDFGLLLEGDTNGDNVLSANDFSLVFHSRNKCTGDTGYNANADFNVDGCVTMDDANFLKVPPIGNMGKTSACTWDSNLSMHRRGRRDSAGRVTLGTTAIPTGLTVGDTFDYTIKVKAGTQFVDTASAYLNFDSERLKVNTMLPGKTFDFVLQNRFDNELGNIDFAAGVWDNEVPKETFTLVTINFTVLKVGGTLSFNTTGHRATTTVSGGRSVTAQDESGEPVIEEVEEIEEPAGEYTAFGIIRDKLGNPIAGVTIQIDGDKTVITDATGSWEINGLAEGEYTVTASKAGYRFDSKPCVVSDNEKACQPALPAESVLDIKVVPEPRVAKQGEDVMYTVTVTNQGEGTATGVTLADVLPDNTELVSIEALDGGRCEAETISCTLPDLTPGATANVKVVVSNSQAKTLINTVTVNTQEYPTDVKKTWTRVIPYLSVSVTDQPDPIEMLKVLHYSVAVELSHYAPTDATDVTLVSQLSKGVELKALNSDYALCESSAFPQISCQFNDLSVASPDSVSQATVEMEVELKDAGLLLLTHEAKVTASEYPAHLVRERTTVLIPDGIQVDLALVIDVTGSMQEEMNGVIKALTEFTAEMDSSTAPLMALLTFGDDVKVAAFTRDMAVLRGAIENLTASGGGLCEEASVEALLVAIPHTKEGGDILFATDASPYDDADVEKVMTLLRGKGIRFNAMITGDCSKEESWNNVP